MRCLTLCHDCVMLQYGDSKDSKDCKEVLTGASLDEQCLLNMVKDEGLARFTSRSEKMITIEIGAEHDASVSKDAENEFEILALNEFTSDRKLMSIAVRRKADQKCYVYAKGAESQIMARLS